MEQKDTTLKKLPYVAPEITVLRILTQDVITASTTTWFDEFDNGADDNFTIE